jgi:hypothetical protein
MHVSMIEKGKETRTECFFSKNNNNNNTRTECLAKHTHTQLDAASSATLLPIIGRQGILLKEAKPQTGTAKIKIPEGL